MNLATRLIAIALLVSSLIGCDDYPQDPGGSLQQAADDKLRVGLIHSPPWVSLATDEPNGTEVEIVASFASRLDTQVEWVQGAAQELMPLLSVGELHLVIGGLTADNPWRHRVGLTDPYTKEAVFVCATAQTPLPDEIEGREVAVAQGSAIAADVKHKEGVPVIVPSLQPVDGFYAISERDAEAHGCTDNRLQIATRKHVIAVPKGENGLLMALEEHLNAAGY